MLQLFLFYSRLIFTSFGENGNLLPHAPACNNDTPISEDFSCKNVRTAPAASTRFLTNPDSTNKLLIQSVFFGAPFR